MFEFGRVKTPPNIGCTYLSYYFFALTCALISTTASVVNFLESFLRYWAELL